MLDVRCPRCGTVHHASPEHLGRQLRCAGCGSSVIIALPPHQDARSRAIRVDRPSPQHSKPTKSRDILSWGHALSGRTGRFWIGVFSFVTLAILTTIGVEFSGRQPSKEDATINHPRPIAKSESQEVAAAQPSGTMSPILPAPTTQSCNETNARRLANGFLLGDEERSSGLGTLRINNGTKYDGVLNLVESESGATIRSVYVRNHDRVSIPRLTPGIYRAYFALGIDWDDEESSFVCDSDYKEFGRSLIFQERADAAGTEYSELQITLHRVTSGNVVSRSISKAVFHSTLPHRRSNKNSAE